MNVNTTFLNGHLEEISVCLKPKAFVSKSEKVRKLHISIYGLKQTSRSWNIHFDTKIKLFGFIQNKDGNCVYQKVVGSVVMFLV